MASKLTEDEKYMKQALRLAKKAMDSGDVYIATRKHAVLGERARDFLRYIRQFYATPKSL